VRVKSMTARVRIAALVLALATVCPSMAQKNHPEEHPQKKQQQQHHAGEWLRQHRNLPPEQQRKALESDPQFRNLPPQRQQQLRNQLQRFNNVPPEKQQQMLNRMETWEHLTPEQKQQARQIHDQMQQLPQSAARQCGTSFKPCGRCRQRRGSARLTPTLTRDNSRRRNVTC